MASVPPTSRQLLLVVEGTAALGHHWELIRTEYVDKIVRSFCEGDNSNQKTPGSAELALVVFYTHGPYSGCLLQQTGWTSSLDRFWQSLSCINFTGGGFADAAVAEGLAEALLMCSPTTVANSITQVTDRQKHCILVAASNPHRLPTPIPRPPVQSLLQPSAGSDPSAVEHWWLADADTVAKAFPQCSVSLSVISPRQLQSLKSIYTVAKRSSCGTDNPLEVSKFAHHMVLISESFTEGRQALVHSSVGSMSVVPPAVLPKVEAVSSTSLSSTSQTPAPTVRATTVGRSTTANGIMSTGTAMKLEASSVPMMAATGVTNVASSALLQNATPISHSMAHSASSQDSSVVTDSSVGQEFKPIGNSAGASLRSGPMTAGNVSLLPTSAQVRPILGPSVANSLGLPGGTISAGGVQLPGLLSSSSASSVMTPSQTLINGPPSGMNLSNNQMGIGMGHNVAQGVGIGGFNNASNLTGNPSLGAVQPGGPGSSSVSNMQVVGMGQSLAGLGQNNLSVGANQIGPTGHVMAGQNVLPALGSVGVSPSPPTMIPTPGIAQPVQGLQPMGAVNSSALQTMGVVSNNSLQAPALVATPPQQSAAPKYMKLWEGILTGQRQGQPVSICKLEAFRTVASPETLAADWPSQMQIVRLIPQDYMHTKSFQGKSEILAFRTVGPSGQQGFLVQLAEKKLCAVIQLPSQTLLLATHTDAKKQDRMWGMLFPGDMVVLKPQVSSHQQQLQQQPPLMAGSATTQSFSSQNQLPNQVRPQLLQPGQLPGQGPATGFMQ